MNLSFFTNGQDAAGHQTIKLYMQDEHNTVYTMQCIDGQLSIKKDTTDSTASIIITTGPGVNNLKLK